MNGSLAGKVAVVTGVTRRLGIEADTVELDLAPLVRFLASDESGWITGQVIRSRGGS